MINHKGEQVCKKYTGSKDFHQTNKLINNKYLTYHDCRLCHDSPALGCQSEVAAGTADWSAGCWAVPGDGAALPAGHQGALGGDSTQTAAGGAAGHLGPCPGWTVYPGQV